MDYQHQVLLQSMVNYCVFESVWFFFQTVFDSFSGAAPAGGCMLALCCDERIVSAQLLLLLSYISLSK
jgi:enoyl-CoA hydratase/carnithine racemase